MTDIVIEGSIHDLYFVYGVFEYLSEQDNIHIKHIHVPPIFQSLANSFKSNTLNEYKNNLNIIPQGDVCDENIHEDIIVYESNNSNHVFNKVIDCYRIIEKMNTVNNSVLYIGSSFYKREKHTEKSIFNGRKEIEMVLKFNEKGLLCSWLNNWTMIDKVKRQLYYIIRITISYVYILFKKYYDNSSVHIIYINELIYSLRNFVNCFCTHIK